MPTAKPTNDAAIQPALSAPRISTYLAATDGDTGLALELYGWNARISAALMLPTHFAEVTTRNAVSDALTAVYGAQWPWDLTFETSLPAPAHGYNPRHDLRMTRARESTTGKVIAELKSVFWQKMFTARHDGRVWNHQILNLFPNTDPASAAHLCQQIYDDLDVIRLLRNRVAHHGPIFARNLTSDLVKMLDLIAMRSAATGTWVGAMEKATVILAEKP